MPTGDAVRVREPDVDVDRPSGPHRGRSPKLLLALAAALLVLVGAGVWLVAQVNPPGEPGPEVVLEIPYGTASGRIASLLEERRVISDASIFRLYARLQGGRRWQAGRYSFREHSSMGSALKVLNAGPTVQYERLTIPEGFTLDQIAQRVGALPGRSTARFLALAASGSARSKYQPSGSASLEGLLLPDTYTVSQRDDEATILGRMVRAFDDRLDELGFAPRAAELGLSPYRAVIVASMVEREARVASERGQVARVVYNRLAKGMPLGIDATTRYELHKPTGPLLQSELQRDSPYNTRTRAGLPPTPIASPGRSALVAAVDPTPGPWLYYVIADADGHHVFVTTPAEFERARIEAKAKGLL